MKTSANCHLDPIKVRNCVLCYVCNFLVMLYESNTYAIQSYISIIYYSISVILNPTL